MKRSFTIIEILISTMLLGIIMGVIFKIYINVLDISTRIENEKIINTDMFFVAQNIQNLADKYKIDFDKYDQNDISSKFGITKILYLSGENENVNIYATGDCEDTLQAVWTKKCRIQMDKNGELIDLTDKDKVYTTKFYFKILPYGDVKQFHLNFEDLYQNGFWVFSESYIKRYNVQKRPFNVKLNSQTFYNLRKYDF